MSKRLLFILLPILAILLSSYDSKGGIMPIKKEVAGLFFSGGNTHIEVSVPSDLQKHQRQLHKNKIRIKAKDTNADADISICWEPAVSRIISYASVTFSGYVISAITADLWACSLRGPPVA